MQGPRSYLSKDRKFEVDCKRLNGQNFHGRNLNSTSPSQRKGLILVSGCIFVRKPSEKHREIVSLMHSKKSFNNRQRTRSKGGKRPPLIAHPQQPQLIYQFVISYTSKISMTPHYQNDNGIYVTAHCNLGVSR